MPSIRVFATFAKGTVDKFIVSPDMSTLKDYELDNVFMVPLNKTQTVAEIINGQTRNGMLLLHSEAEAEYSGSFNTNRINPAIG